MFTFPMGFNRGKPLLNYPGLIYAAFFDNAANLLQNSKPNSVVATSTNLPTFESSINKDGGSSACLIQNNIITDITLSGQAGAIELWIFRATSANFQLFFDLGYNHYSYINILPNVASFDHRNASNSAWRTVVSRAFTMPINTWTHVYVAWNKISGVLAQNSVNNYYYVIVNGQKIECILDLNASMTNGFVSSPLKLTVFADSPIYIDRLGIYIDQPYGGNFDPNTQSKLLF